MARTRIGKAKTVVFDDVTCDRIAKIAKKQRNPESEVIRRMVDIGLDAYDTYSLIGVPQLAELVNQIRRACSLGLEERKEELRKI